MKKTLKFLAAVTLIALTAAACQKEKLSDSSAEGTESVTFTVQTDAATTKASADGDGSGTGLNRCLVAVYMKTGNSAEPYKLYDTPSTTKQDNEHYSFTVNLIRKQTYQIVVWADKGENVYDVNDGLTLVKRKTNDFACNSDAYDAFYASTEFVQGTTNSTNITAKRPFAQLNLITKDLNEEFQPGAVSVTYTSPQSFNPFDGSVSDMTEVIYKADSPYYTSTTGTAATQHTLVMNYLFAAAEEQTILPSVKMTAKLTVDADIAVANVPVKRNYRTNIIGNLLTEQTNFTINVAPAWGDSDIDVEWVSVATVTDANLALQNGKTNVAIESVETDGSAILIPETSKTIGISLPSDNANAVTIAYKNPTASGQTPNLNVAAESNTGNLVIEAPQSHVTLNGAAYNNVTASTSNTTLVVEEGVTIKNLTVNQGAVEIYGTVNSISLTEGCAIKVWAVGEASAFNMALEKGAETIELKNDIAFSTPIKVTRSITISGNGHNVYNTANRVMSFQDTNGAILSLNNLGLISNCTASSDVRGLSIWRNNSSEIVLDNCTVSASFYAINFSSDNDNLSITIKNGTVAGGWAAINSYANNSTFTIKNSTLKGLNDKGESDWNDFATIVFDGYGLSIAENIGKLGTGNKLNVVNSTIYASSESSNKQAWLALQYGAQRNIVNVDAATRIIDEADNDQTDNIALRPVVGHVNNSFTTIYDLKSEIWIGGAFVYPGYAASIGSTYYKTLAEAISATLGDVTVVLKPGDHTLPTNLAGRSITLEGTDVETTVIDMSAGGTPQYGAKSVTFKNVTVKRNSGPYGGLSHCGEEHYVDSKVEGTLVTYAPVVTAVNTEFKQTSSGSYNIHIYGEGSVNLENCKFHCEGKSIYAHSERASEHSISIKDCEFTANQTVTGKAAIQLHTELGIHGTLDITNSTATGFDSSINDGLWNELNNSTKVPTNNFVKTVNGVQITQ